MKRESLTLEALRVLDAIDRKGSFAAAAAELFKVPSAITYSVRRLEDELGVTLFDRTGPRPEFTETGRMVLEEGRVLLAGAARLAESARQIESGWETRLCIALDTAIPLSALHSILKEFDTLQADVSIQIASESLGGCWEALTDGRADLAIGAVADVCPPGRFETRRLGVVPHLLVARPGHEASLPAVTLPREALHGHRLVVIADSARDLPRRSLGWVDTPQRLVVADMRQKYDAIRAGIGIGHLPEFWVREAVANGELCVLETIDEPPSVESLIAWPRGRDGRALRWFATAALEELTGKAGIFGN